jgi:cysteine-rich repeat protein
MAVLPLLTLALGLALQVQLTHPNYSELFFTEAPHSSSMELTSSVLGSTDAMARLSLAFWHKRRNNGGTKSMIQFSKDDSYFLDLQADEDLARILFSYGRTSLYIEKPGSTDWCFIGVALGNPEQRLRGCTDISNAVSCNEIRASLGAIKPPFTLQIGGGGSTGTAYGGRVGGIVMWTDVFMTQAEFQSQFTSRPSCPDSSTCVGGGHFYDSLSTYASLLGSTSSAQSNNMLSYSFQSTFPEVSITDSGVMYGRTPSTSLSDFSVVGWVKMSSVTEASVLAVTAASACSYSISVSSSMWTFNHIGTSCSSTPLTTTVAATTNWTRVVLAVGSILSVGYVNSTPTGTLSTTPQLLANSGSKFSLGPVAGQYHDWRVYFRALTAADLATADLSLTRTEPMLHCDSRSYDTCSTCSAGYFLSQGLCKSCLAACSTCSSADSCTQCAAGYYAYPKNTSSCQSSCPSGYTADAVSRSCTVSSDLNVASVTFAEDLSGEITLKSGSVLKSGLSSDYYPQYDFMDAYPSNKRGRYLKAKSVLQISSGGLVLNSDLAVSMWILPVYSGSLLTSVLNDGYNDLYYLEFGFSDNYLSLHLLKSPSNSYERFECLSCLVELKTAWHHVGFIISYAQASSKTTVTVFLNNASQVFSFSGQFIDNSKNRHWIGWFSQQYPPFEGYLYAFDIFNEAKTLTQLTALRGSCGSCQCPAGASSCLPICKFTEYVDSANKCQPCLAACTEGCSKANSCNLCSDELCKICSNYSAGSCTQCFPGTQLINGKCSCITGYFVQGQSCVETCSAGYFLDAASATCKACPAGCTECVADKCTSCESNLALIEGECSCGFGYYWSQETCSKCNAVCESCAGSAESCTSCLPEYFAYYDQCQLCSDFEGYAGTKQTSQRRLADDLDELVKANCREICGDGKNFGGLACDDGNTQDGDGCSQACTVENSWTCSGGSPSSADICVDLVAPSAILEYDRLSGASYYLWLYFTEVVEVQGNLKDLVSVSSDDIARFSFDLTEKEGRNYTSYQLKVTVDISVSSGSTVKLKFDSVSKITDATGLALETSSVEADLGDAYTDTTQEALNAVAFTAAAFCGSVAASSAGLGSAMGGSGGSLGSVWGLVESLQIINYMVYLSIDMPSSLRSFLRLLSFANMNFLPNIFEQLIPIKDTFDDPPSSFKGEEVSTNFLLNTGNVVTLWLIIGSFFLIAIIVRLIFKKSDKARSFFNSFVFSAFLRTLVETFCEIFLGVCLQLRDLNAKDNASIAAVVMAFASLAGIVGFVALIWRLVVRVDEEQLLEPTHKRRFGTLYEGFLVEFKITKSFLLASTLRRIVLIVMLVALSGEQVAQIVMVALSSLAFFAFLLVARPYSNHYSGNGLSAFSEFTILTSQVMMFGFIGSGFHDLLGIAIIVLLMSGILLSTAVMMHSQIKALASSIRKVLDKWKRKYRANGSRALEDMESNGGNNTPPDSIFTHSVKVVPTDLTTDSQAGARDITRFEESKEEDLNPPRIIFRK